MNDTWKTYFENTKNQPPRPLLVKALSFVNNKDVALDLGPGALNDSIYLLKVGFEKVIALDKEAVASEIAEKLPKDRFEYAIKSFEGFDFPRNNFDLINAQYSLPFIAPSKFIETFEKILKSLKSGGVFTGQLFGDKDEWVKNSSMTFQRREEAEKLLADFDILSFEEEERDRPTAAKEMKHWHVFHFIARKR